MGKRKSDETGKKGAGAEDFEPKTCQLFVHALKKVASTDLGRPETEQAFWHLLDNLNKDHEQYARLHAWDTIASPFPPV